MASPVRADLQQAPARPELTVTGPSVLAALAPLMVVVLVAYLIIGLAMPVLPLYVHQELGLSTFMVGVAAGIEFAAALLSRFWSGRYADTRGAKRAMVAGLLMGAASGLFYLLSLNFAHSPAVGLVANHAGLQSVFFVSTLVVLCAAAIAVRLLRAPGEPSAHMRR